MMSILLSDSFVDSLNADQYDLENVVPACQLTLLKSVVQQVTNLTYFG